MSLEGFAAGVRKADGTRRRRLVTNRSIVTYPASSKIENCLDRAESDIPRRSRTNEKSAQSVEAKSATMDKRVLG